MIGRLMIFFDFSIPCLELMVFEDPEDELIGSLSPKGIFLVNSLYSFLARWRLIM